MILERRLKACEECFHKSYGANLERLTVVKVVFTFSYIQTVSFPFITCLDLCGSSEQRAIIPVGNKIRSLIKLDILKCDNYVSLISKSTDSCVFLR